jgi:hypothetical protein
MLERAMSAKSPLDYLSKEARKLLWSGYNGPDNCVLFGLDNRRLRSADARLVVIVKGLGGYIVDFRGHIYLNRQLWRSQMAYLLNTRCSLPWSRALIEWRSWAIHIVLLRNWQKIGAQMNIWQYRNLKYLVSSMDFALELLERVEPRIIKMYANKGVRDMAIETEGIWELCRLFGYGWISYELHDLTILQAQYQRLRNSRTLDMAVISGAHRCGMSWAELLFWVNGEMECADFGAYRLYWVMSYDWEKKKAQRRASSCVNCWRWAPLQGSRFPAIPVCSSLQMPAARPLLRAIIIRTRLP